MAIEIHFEDHGQDFLWWKLDEAGKVIDCGPFQGSIWCGKQVQDHNDLKPGDRLSYPDSVGHIRTIKYAIQSIKQI